MEGPRSHELEFGQAFRVVGEGAPGKQKPKLLPGISYISRWSIWLRLMKYKDTESRIDQLVVLPVGAIQIETFCFKSL